jgi:hypothetical protein
MYTMVEEAQAEVEEVRRKEARDAKFQYSSVTFQTFKPTSAKEGATPIPPQDEEQQQQHDHRFPSFARNHNPNRAMLARSYEVVTPIGFSGATGGGASSSGTNLASGHSSGEFQLEEYDKLMHQERKMTGASQTGELQRSVNPSKRMASTSQRNFSISTKVQGNSTNYSQLEIKSKPPVGENDELGIRRIKPVIKQRTRIQADPPSNIPSYTLVKKPKGPPLPPRCGSQEEVTKEETEEDYYKVPKSILKSEMLDSYGKQVRTAWSYENIGQDYWSDEINPSTHYDDVTPSMFSHGREAVSQQSLVHEEPMYINSVAEVLQNAVSVGSYIDMTGSQVSYI